MSVRYESVRISELNPGDVVLTSAGPARVPQEGFREYPDHSASGHYGNVRHADCHVLYPSLIRDPFVQYFVREDGGTWAVQSNDAARWERALPVSLTKS